MKNYLNFENDIKSIEAEIDKLKDPYNNEGISTVDTGKIDKLQSDLDKKLKDIYFVFYSLIYNILFNSIFTRIISDIIIAIIILPFLKYNEYCCI